MVARARCHSIVLIVTDTFTRYNCLKRSVVMKQSRSIYVSVRTAASFFADKRRSRAVAPFILLGYVLGTFQEKTRCQIMLQRMYWRRVRMNICRNHSCTTKFSILSNSKDYASSAYTHKISKLRSCPSKEVQIHCYYYYYHHHYFFFFFFVFFFLFF
jgi:hypothetical protein